jgi:hypothetical protein
MAASGWTRLKLYIPKLKLKYDSGATTPTLPDATSITPLRMLIKT